MAFWSWDSHTCGLIDWYECPFPSGYDPSWGTSKLLCAVLGIGIFQFCSNLELFVAGRALKLKHLSSTYSDLLLDTDEWRTGPFSLIWRLGGTVWFSKDGLELLMAPIDLLLLSKGWPLSRNKARSSRHLVGWSMWFGFVIFVTGRRTGLLPVVLAYDSLSCCLLTKQWLKQILYAVDVVVQLSERVFYGNGVSLWFVYSHKKPCVLTLRSKSLLLRMYYSAILFRDCGWYRSLYYGVC